MTKAEKIFRENVDSMFNDFKGFEFKDFYGYCEVCMPAEGWTLDELFARINGEFLAETDPYFHKGMIVFDIYD